MKCAREDKDNELKVLSPASKKKCAHEDKHSELKVLVLANT